MQANIVVRAENWSKVKILALFYRVSTGGLILKVTWCVSKVNTLMSV